MTPKERKKAEIAAKAMKGKPVQPPRCLSAPGTKAPHRQPAKSQPAQEPKGYGAPTWERSWVKEVFLGARVLQA
jgi:hypothetical protein